MRLVVIGRQGQVALSLKERAASRSGIELIAIGRPEIDLERSGSAARAIAAAAPQVVVNAAAYTFVDQAEDEPDLAFRVNADAAGEIAAAACAAGAPIIQLSTDYVFDGNETGAYREDAATNPLGAYGKSKLAGEEQARANNPEHVIVRTAWVYSPFGRNFVKTMIEAARTRDSLSVVADQFGSPTSALDLADCLLTMIERWAAGERTGIGETYHLAGSGETSWAGIAQAVMDECRARDLPAAAVKPISTQDWPTKVARPRNSVLDSSKFARDFGSRLPDWRTSVAYAVERLSTAP